MTDMIEARAARLADQPLRLASPQTGFASGTLQSLRDIVAHRELLGLLVSRELKARYKDSSLGFIWSLIRPLVMLLIYYVAVSYTHLRAHETDSYLVCRLLLEKKK